MLKLHRSISGQRDYWETWDDGSGTQTVHWGLLGTRGETKTLKSTFFRKAETILQKEIDRLLADGFRPVEPDDYVTLMVEYAIDGMGTVTDLEKRHRLEDRMNGTLGWTGLGSCDGGSTGSGTMEVCNLVVDFDLAKSVIEKDLAGTEFSDCRRIYEENDVDGDSLSEGSLSTP